MMEVTENTELQIRFIDILTSGNRLLAIVTLNQAFQFFLSRVFFKVGKYHLHLCVSSSIILACEGGVAVAFVLGMIDYH